MLLQNAISIWANAGFDPRGLFLNGEQGMWYDLNDSSTVFQDSAGTTPATWGDPVGRVLDKSGNGNHRIQAASGARPILGREPKRGAVNELVSTDTLATQNVTVTAAERTLSFKGTGTVTLSGASTAGPLAGTGADDRVSLTFTPTAGTLTLTISGSVTEAQLQLGSAFDSYQRVGTTQYDITESGQPSVAYLSYNGTNQWMQTASTVDFSGTDEMSVFAGVRKLSDAAAGTILSNWIGAFGTGGLAIFAPVSVAANFAFDMFAPTSTGSSYTRGLIAPYASPTNRVLSANMDMSQAVAADELKIRVDGADVTPSYSGTTPNGNFGNEIFRFGARRSSGGTPEIFFNGKEYSTIIRGALTSGSLLNRTEQYIARNTAGVTL